MKKNKSRIIASVLIAVLFVVSLFNGIPEKRVEPENPLITKADVLKTDLKSTAGGKKAETDEQAVNSQDGNDDQTDQKQEEASQEKEKNEDSKEEKEEENPEEQRENENNNDADQNQTDQEQKDNGNSNDETVAGDQGENNSKNPGKNESGQIPDDTGDKKDDRPGSGDQPGEKEEGLITDLYSRIITVSELEQDTIKFYAYYSDADVDANIKVNYKHESDHANGKWLTKEEEHDYKTKLKLGKNYITIYYSDKEGNRNYVRIVLTYQEEKADASRPEVGEHPPVIETNLDDWTGDMNTSEFTFTVNAKNWKGKRIYADSIQVMLDGQPVTNPTGNGIYEYVLRFERPKVGDWENHKVSVLAWDSEGNSRYIEYSIRYQYHNTGEHLGSVHVVIDATTVECGIVDEADIELVAGDTAASVVLKMLDEYGYDCRSSGSSSSEFYLASISRADAFRGCHIGERLQRLLERDGITFTSPGTRDELGEFDFTRGSGWLYFINGSLCPGKAMSAWTLNGGETISLRYTLAYGKDVGGSSSTEGTLSGYCAQWVDGQVIETEHDYQETSRVEPGRDTDGYIEYTCSRCGETKRDILPATGGEPENPDQPGGGGEPENPDQPGGGGEPENPDQPGGGGEPENPDQPGGGGEPENLDQPGGGEESANPESAEES